VIVGARVGIGVSVGSGVSVGAAVGGRVSDGLGVGVGDGVAVGALLGAALTANVGVGVGVAVGSGAVVVAGPALAAIVTLGDVGKEASATVVGDGGRRVAPGVREGSGVGPVVGRVSRMNVVAPTRMTRRAASEAVRI
jgi:hypothetical protein